MKKIVCITILFVQYNLLLSNTDIMPFNDLVIGTSYIELIQKYPLEEYELFKRKRDTIPEEAGIILRIQNNEFWDTLVIYIKDYKIKHLTYFFFNTDLLQPNTNSHNNQKSLSKFKPLSQQLQKQFGKKFEKKVIYLIVGKQKTRSAMYVWKRKNDYVVFCHTPVALHDENDVFMCQLSIMPSLDFFEYEMATNSLPEDALLWADAMGDYTSGSSGRFWWLLTIPAFATVCGLVRLRKKYPST